MNLIEGQHINRGRCNTYFEATIVQSGGDEFKPLMSQGVEIPDYYVSADGRFASTKRGIQILDYTRKRNNQTKNYKKPLAFNASLPQGFFNDYDYTTNTSSKNLNVNIRYHRGVIETWKPIDKYPPDRLKDCWKDIPEEAKQWIRESAYVDHIDDDTSNNHIDNLRWCTPKQNSKQRKNYAKVN